MSVAMFVCDEQTLNPKSHYNYIISKLIFQMHLNRRRMHVRNYKISIYVMCSNYTVESVDCYLLKMKTHKLFWTFRCSEIFDYVVHVRESNCFDEFDRN